MATIFVANNIITTLWSITFISYAHSSQATLVEDFSSFHKLFDSLLSKFAVRSIISVTKSKKIFALYIIILYNNFVQFYGKAIPSILKKMEKKVMLTVPLAYFCRISMRHQLYPHLMP